MFKVSESETVSPWRGSHRMGAVFKRVDMRRSAMQVQVRAEGAALEMADAISINAGSSRRARGDNTLTDSELGAYNIWGDMLATTENRYMGMLTRVDAFDEFVDATVCRSFGGKGWLVHRALAVNAGLFSSLPFSRPVHWAKRFPDKRQTQ